MVEGTPEKTPCRPWRLEHVGSRRNPDKNAVESKAKCTSRLVAHHGHAGGLGEGGDGLEWPGHVEAMVAELRPGSGKKLLRRATPANSSGVSKS